MQIQQSAGGLRAGTPEPEDRNAPTPPPVVHPSAADFPRRPSAAFIPAIAVKASAAGIRNRETGALTNVGTNGDYYGSSSFASGNNNASYLTFTASNVNPLNAGTRANGRSVRCVQHLRSCFLFPTAK